MKKNCINCQKELGDNWVNVIKVDFAVEKQEGDIHFHINSQESMGELCRNCLTLYLQDCSRILKHYMECDKKEHLSPPVKRERLRRKVAKLEAIINRTPQQEKDLKDKRQKLAELEKEKQQSQDPKKTNWTPWLIGGGIILVLVIGIIAYFWEKSEKEKENK